MIQQIVALSLKFRILIVGAAILLLAQGGTQLPNAPVDVLPEFAPPEVQIQTEALGLSAAEVEQLITVPIEHDLLNGVAWLSQIRSESAPGLSTIDLIFEPGTDLLKARQLVQERMTQAHALPNVGSPPVMIQPESSTSRVTMIGLSSTELSLVDLSVLARWKVKPRLMGVPGVANVAIWGQRDRQLQVRVNPDQLRKNGVTLTQVITTAGNALWASPLTFLEASTPGTGGFIETPSQRFAIQHILPITTAQGLASVTIQDTGGRTLRLDQVATVVEDHQPLIGDAVLANGPGLMLVIQKFPGAKTQEVAKGIDQALSELRPGLPGVQIDTNVYQANTYIQSAMHNLAMWVSAALVLLVVVLAIGLLSWRLALITFVVIVLSLIAAVVVLYLAGVTFNVMVLAGLAVALGLVIDDAVGDVWSIRRRFREQRLSDKTPPMDAIARASSFVRGAMGYATLIVLVVPLPFVFQNGVAAAFARPAVLAYGVAVLASTLVALTLTPVLALFLLRNESLEPRSSPLVRWGHQIFDRTARWFMRRPRRVWLTVAVLLLAVCAAAPQLNGGPVLPSLQDRSLVAHLQTISGTSLPEMVRITTAVSREVDALPGVQHVAAHVGRAVASDQVVSVNSGELWIRIADSADYSATVSTIRQALHGYPGLRSDLMTYPQDRVQAAARGMGGAFLVRVYGQDLDVMRSTAEDMRVAISSVQGVVHPQVQTLDEEPTLDVQVNLTAAQLFGLNPGDVRRAATTYFSGLLVGSLYQDQEVFDVVVQGSPRLNASPADVADLLIDTPSGGSVRLGDVATVRVAPHPTVIKHEATLRSIDVTADVSGRPLDSVLTDVKSRVGTVKMPLEYHAVVLSDLAEQKSQDLNLVGLLVAAAVANLLILQAAFGGWRLATLVFLTVPLATAGGVLAALLVGGLMTLGAMIGLLAVLGIATRNSLLLIKHIQRTESVEGTTQGQDSVLRATRGEFGHVVLTAGITAAVFLPLLVIGRTAGTEVLFPMAAVVLGGLITSTLFTLLVLPALYLRLAPAVALPVGEAQFDSR
ncbi:MAG: efflux RND transporter permease subunit [Candidatus Dormibacteraeota bacterium]|nr:efflux RND transporter permease subunit [Candidatus Dormibacteraeota bacterium]